ncbi:MAG TPA: class I SAM-dependent methyltransferase [Allosphingosinicella sp.]|jgi:SAM-dependent methyltransferase
MNNIDEPTARAFDDKWGARYAGTANPERARRAFERLFSLFPFGELREAEGFDLGCGQGRFAMCVAPRVGRLHCIDPSPNGLAVARLAAHGLANVEFHLAGVDDIPLPDASQDFGYSLGVLHHIPDTEAALRRCVAKLKPGAPFLLYLYYDFENRPLWFRAVWRTSDIGRRGISRLPFRLRRFACDSIAATIYWPLSRVARLIERVGGDPGRVPLGSYRDARLGNMRVAALDRFGTRLEQRFSRAAIEAMMRRCGLGAIRFRDGEPYWVAIGRKGAGG